MRTLSIDYDGELGDDEHDAIHDIIGSRFQGSSDAPYLDDLVHRLEAAEADNAWLRGQVEFGIAKCLAMSTQMSEQAAVHHKRELLLDRATRSAARHLLHVKEAGEALRRARARIAELEAEARRV